MMPKRPRITTLTVAPLCRCRHAKSAHLDDSGSAWGPTCMVAGCDCAGYAVPRRLARRGHVATDATVRP